MDDTADTLLRGNVVVPMYKNFISNEPINFSKKNSKKVSQSEKSTWKYVAIFNMCSLGCNYFVIFFVYALIVGMGILIQNKDVFSDLTVYTQGAKEWTLQPWIDFIWTPYQCPEGYEAIQNTWLGTVEGV